MARLTQTIPRALWASAEHRADVGFTFVGDAGPPLALPFAELASRVRARAHAFAAMGLARGERVALILPQGHEFVVAFLGAIAAGAVPVPLHPPMGLGQLGPPYLAHVAHVVASSRSRFLVTTETIRAELEALRAFDAAPTLARAFVFGELVGDAALYREEDADGDDVAFLQFTSGSTARPKGVVLSHANVAANAAAINDALGVTPDDAGVSWLPLFHDMGLIGFVIAALYARTSVTIMPPMMFLKRPATWLKTLSGARGTISFAPSFAYGLATRRIRDADMEGVDLSSWRIAGCGAEPISAPTLRAFADRFAPWGFRSTAFVPSYGMAEATLGVTFARSGRELRVERVDGVEIVSCGVSPQGHDVRVVSQETIDGEGDMASLPERAIGEVVVRGPSVTSGYFEDAEKTLATVRRGWLVTGDLGYVADGELFLCGRKKDLIIIHGKNYHPQDFEWEAAQVDGVREGNVVAFATTRADLDRDAVVVVFETRPRDAATAIADEIRRRIHDAFGIAVDDVIAAVGGAIPKTSSGKVQRSAARGLYESGELRRRSEP